MPSNHFNVSPISRKPKTKAQIKSGRGQSAVACAAYRSGEKLQDERLDKTFNYGRKQDIRHTEIMAPEGSPEWVNDRQTLWNKVENAERKSNSLVSREVRAALPRELSTDQQVSLVREFVSENMTSQGMVADVAIHESKARDGETNPHVHIMLTTRDIDGDEFAKHKNRDWDNTAKYKAWQREKKEYNKLQKEDPELTETFPDYVTDVEQWRSSWETITNDHLEDAGSSERLSLQSFADRGLNQEPLKRLSIEEWEMERRGVNTRTGDLNRRTAHFNDVRSAVDALPASMIHLPKESQASAMAHEHTISEYPAEEKEHLRQVRKSVQGIDPDKFDDPIYYTHFITNELDIRAGEYDPESDIDSEQEIEQQPEQWKIAAVSADFWDKYDQVLREENEQRDDGYER